MAQIKMSEAMYGMANYAVQVAQSNGINITIADFIGNTETLKTLALAFASVRVAIETVSGEQLTVINE